MAARDAVSTTMSASTDTIVAMASANAVGAIGVVRASGPRVPAMARTLLGRAAKARYAHWCRFADADGEAIDHGLLLLFPAPHSYTGEDVLELQGHGNPLVLQRLAARLVALGARLAKPGEFSERAFLNGKLDLAQAEAVADLIASGSEAAARAALRSLDGEFSRRVHTLTEAVIRLRVWIEAAIDFAEEEIDFLDDARIAEGLEAVRVDLDQLLAASHRGLRLTDGIHAVIIGRPNAGKSSLLNALAQSQRAIVTAVPGTTRDLLNVTVNIDNVALDMVDTAGMHDTADAIEREGIRRARMELGHADLALLVTDDAHADADAALFGELPSGVTRLIVHNKIDLAAQPPRRQDHGADVHLWLSAKTGHGMELLRAELKRLAGGDSAGEGAFSARARHVAALESAREHVARASMALNDDRAGEVAAEELRDAQRQLDEITGQFSSDDLLGRIFADFCIGK